MLRISCCHPQADHSALVAHCVVGDDDIAGGNLCASAQPAIDALDPRAGFF